MNHSGFPVKAIRKASTHLTEEGRSLTREYVLKRSVLVGGVHPVKTESAFGIASFLGRKGGCLHRTIWRSLLKGSCASETMPAKSWQSLVFFRHCLSLSIYQKLSSVCKRGMNFYNLLFFHLIYLHCIRINIIFAPKFILWKSQTIEQRIRCFLLLISKSKQNYDCFRHRESV